MKFIKYIALYHYIMFYLKCVSIDILLLLLIKCSGYNENI
jgi:hypothetical protein